MPPASWWTARKWTASRVCASRWSVFLSPIDQRLAQMLVEHFGSVVTERELIAHVWPDGATNQALRVHVSRLRQRVEPIGLNITCARGTGYVITETNRDVGSN